MAKRKGRPSFNRCLVLTPAQQQELLERLNATVSRSAVSKRRAERHDYDVADIPVCIEHPDGGQSFFLMYGRNVSRSGIGLIHGRYVHPNSICRLVLRTEDGPMVVSGVVRHCRLIGGNCHEVGVSFTEEVDLDRVLDGRKARESAEQAAADEGPGSSSSSSAAA